MVQISSAWSNVITAREKVSAIFGGLEKSKFVPFDGAANDFYGFITSLSQDGSTMAIGAYQDDDKGSNSGSVYIYRRSGESWVRSIKLTAYDGYSNDYYGYAIALSGDGNTIIIGAYQDDDGGISSGGAYIYTRSGPGMDDWTLQSKIMGASTHSGDYFGRAVDISDNGNRVVVGAYMDANAGSGAGTIFIFDRINGVWTEICVLVGNDTAANDYFGRSVCISSDGQTVMSSAYQDDDKGSRSGSVYVFRQVNGVWTQKAKIVPADGAANDYFGFSLDMNGNGTKAAIASYLDDDKGSNSGSVYIFNEINGVWTQEIKLYAPDEASSDYFGYSLCMDDSGLNIIISSYLDDDMGSSSGSAYYFNKANGVWTSKYKLTAYDGLANDYFGFSVSLSGNGSVVVCGAYMGDGYLNATGCAYLFE